MIAPGAYLNPPTWIEHSCDWAATGIDVLDLPLQPPEASNVMRASFAQDERAEAVVALLDAIAGLLIGRVRPTAVVPDSAELMGESDPKPSARHQESMSNRRSLRPYSMSQMVARSDISL
jgi:hypothetical protein